MKFAEHLSAHITPEWRKQYIEYEKMKGMLYEAQEAMPTDEDTDPTVVERYLSTFKEKFFRFCELELKKINVFFSEKLAESLRKLANLKSDLEQLKSKASESQGDKKKHRKVVFSTKTQHDLKLAYSEFYLSLILLQSYQTLNFTGFRKILKKHDKLFGTAAGAEWRQAQVECSLFYTNKDVDGVIEQVENIVTSELEGGDRGKAMKRLRVPPRGEKQNPHTTFFVGLLMGIFLMMVIVAIFSYVEISLPFPWFYVIRLYRGPMLLILFIVLMGANTYGWRTSGVNHVLIFELDPRNHFTDLHYLEAGGLMAIFWGTSFIFFVYSGYFNIPPLVHPLWMWSLLIIYLLNPLPILHFNARRWLLGVLFKMITAPFHHVTFAQFWMADQMNSLALLLLDFEYTVCFYATEVVWNGPRALSDLQTYATCGNGTTVMSCQFGINGTWENACGEEIAITQCEPMNSCVTNQYGIRPLIALFPAMCRFLQCWRRYWSTKHAFPHVVNAFKYSTTFFVVIFSTLNTWYKDTYHSTTTENPFFWLWLLSAVVSSCYTYTWDIKMDWGLMDKNAGENKLLREETVYRYKGYYYFAMVEDFILRFAWTVTMTVSETGVWDSEIVKTVTGVLEVFRRIIWNFFRLENEHLNNCGEFRAVRDISITPIDHSDQVLLEKMMDEDDGVINRKDKFPNKKKSGLRRRDPKTWTIEEDDEEQTDTWTAFKGGIQAWINSRRQSADRRSNLLTPTSPNAPINNLKAKEV